MIRPRSPDSSFDDQDSSEERRMHVCPNPDSYSKTCFSPFTIKLLVILSKGGGSLQGMSLLWPAFAWQSNKAIFFFSFTPVSVFQFSPGRQRQNSSNILTSVINNCFAQLQICLLAQIGSGISQNFLKQYIILFLLSTYLSTYLTLYLISTTLQKCTYETTSRFPENKVEWTLLYLPHQPPA